jgi:hypothetical protein
MKCMIVYWNDGKWFASDVQWKRSGSGSYRETSPLVIPQTKEEIQKFATENGYSVEWRPPLPPEVPAAAAG